MVCYDNLMPNQIKRAASVMFDHDVLAFLFELTGKDGRSRSWLINYIIRHYAQQLAAKQKEAADKLNRTISY